jgi:hypothetical protein
LSRDEESSIASERSETKSELWKWEGGHSQYGRCNL